MKDSYYDLYMQHALDLTKFEYSASEVKTMLSKFVPQMIALDSLIPDKNKLDSQQEQKLKDIYFSLKTVDELLLPFRQGNLHYELAVSGGSVYDFLCKNTPTSQDIDIVVHFPDMTDNSEPSNIPEVGQEKFGKLIGNHRPRKKRKNYEPLDLVEMMEFFISRSFNIVEEGNPREMDNPLVYANKYIHRVIHLEDKKMPSSVDIIVSMVPTLKLVELFDFELCKAFMLYRSIQGDEISEKTSHANIHQYGDLLDYTFPLSGFIGDIRNKTLTLDLGAFPQQTISYYMESHYPRLKAKYPDFSLNFLRKEEHPEIAQYYELETSMAKDEHKNRKNKI